MYLKRLRLKGFESFPRQTELLFEPGVAVVIGPNGSGKSNIADAVVWALGEQSPKSVRGSSMQDVIFAGSDKRRAGGSAQVELVFDNTDRALPLPTDEVSVTRSVSRDEGSQYFINRSACRLTDVIELMAQVGLGRELHSIIGQGKVEGFLAEKPEDRRSQIEEAAGLGAYKRRRERAEQKLREAQRNLDRAALVEREVSSQLTPLRRQANAAEELRTVEHAIAELKGRLLTGEVAALDLMLAERTAEREAIEAERSVCESGLVEVADARAREEETFAHKVAARERHAQRLLRTRVLTGRLESDHRLVEQRLRMLNEIASSSAAERQRLVADLTGRPDEPQDRAWEADERRLVEELAAAEGAFAAATEGLNAARTTLAERRASLAELSLQRETASSTTARLERRRAALNEEEARLTERHEVVAAEVERKAEEETVARQAAAAALEELNAAEAAASEAAAVRAEAARATEEALAEHRTRRNECRALAAEAEHLRLALNELHDVAADVLRVADSFPGAASFAGGFSCEPGYERALAAALAQASGALAVPSNVDHWSLLKALRRAGVGVARLILPRPRVQRRSDPPSSFPLLQKVDAGARQEFIDALADVVVVDDLAEVPFGFNGLAVTRAGEYYRPSSGQLGVAAGVPAALMLERRASLERIEAELSAAQVRELRAEATLTEAREREAGLAPQGDVHRAVRTARRAVEEANRAVSAVQGRHRDLLQGDERDRRALEELTRERSELLRELEAAAELVAATTTRLAELEPALAVSSGALEEAEMAHGEALALRTRLTVELDERRAAARRARQQREELRRRAAASRARLAELDCRLESLPAVQRVCEALELRLFRLAERGAQLVARLEGAEAEHASLDRAELTALTEREVGLRRSLEAATERDTELQIALARLRDRRAEQVASLDEVATLLERAQFAAPDDEAEERALRERLQRLARRRDRIGPVNPLAEAECAELSERASFLREQRRDLEKSFTELQELIEELTERIDAEFAETFAAVQEQFSHMVSVLFPGGRGSLKLVDASEKGEAGGVEVEVKPAKKLGKKLQLLSGGERALVAIAFLMALVLARPCPFYILDEIEAALDDINIGRLVQLLRDYRERTQFILITHQKRTMEAADVLYGVTMGADGASQVVSARMAQEAIDREEGTTG